MTKHVCTHCRKTFTNLISLDKHRWGRVPTKYCQKYLNNFRVQTDGSYCYTYNGIEVRDVEVEAQPVEEEDSPEE